MAASEYLTAWVDNLGVIALEGDEEGLSRVEALLLDSESGETAIRIPAPLTGIPNARGLSELRVQRSDSKVKVAARGETLTISGGNAELEILAHNIRYLIEHVGQPFESAHLHIEYHDDHFYLSPDSQPLVIEMLVHEPERRT